MANTIFGTEHLGTVTEACHQTPGTNYPYLDLPQQYPSEGQHWPYPLGSYPDEISFPSDTHVRYSDVWTSISGTGHIDMTPEPNNGTSTMSRVPNVLDNKEVFLYACALRQPPRAVRKPPWRTRAKKLPYYRVDSVCSVAPAITYNRLTNSQQPHGLHQDPSTHQGSAVDAELPPLRVSSEVPLRCTDSSCKVKDEVFKSKAAHK
jgi:hypothetical protein